MRPCLWDNTQERALGRAQDGEGCLWTRRGVLLLQDGHQGLCVPCSARLVVFSQGCPRERPPAQPPVLGACLSGCGGWQNASPVSPDPLPPPLSGSTSVLLNVLLLVSLLSFDARLLGQSWTEPAAWSLNLPSALVCCCVDGPRAFVCNFYYAVLTPTLDSFLNVFS